MVFQASASNAVIHSFGFVVLEAETRLELTAVFVLDFVRVLVRVFVLLCVPVAVGAPVFVTVLVGCKVFVVVPLLEGPREAEPDIERLAVAL